MTPDPNTAAITRPAGRGRTANQNTVTKSVVYRFSLIKDGVKTNPAGSIPATTAAAKARSRGTSCRAKP